MVKKSRYGAERLENSPLLLEHSIGNEVEPYIVSIKGKTTCIFQGNFSGKRET